MQLDFAASTLLRRVHHAGVERARIDVQADGTLVELAGIDDSMHRIGGVDRTGMGDVHLDGIKRFQLAKPSRQILINKMEIFYLEPAEWDCHPAVLVAMIVNGAGLTDLPANGHQFVKWSAINQITRVVLPIPGEIRRKGFGIDWHLREELAQRLGGDECGLRQYAQLFDEFLNGNRFGGGNHRYTGARVPFSAKTQSA